MNVLYFRFANSLLETSEQDVWAAMTQRTFRSAAKSMTQECFGLLWPVPSSTGYPWGVCR